MVKDQGDAYLVGDRLNAIIEDVKELPPDEGSRVRRYLFLVFAKTALNLWVAADIDPQFLGQEIGRSLGGFI